MKVIIAVAKVPQKSVILDAIKESQFHIDSIVIGNKDSEDVIDDIVMKEGICKHMRLCIPSPNLFPDNGRMRNINWMLNTSDALIAIWDGVSEEVHSIIDAAYKKGMKVYVKAAF